MNLKSAKRQFQAMLIGLFLLGSVAYFFSFSNTLEALRLKKLNKQAIRVANDAPREIRYYQQLMGVFDSQITNKQDYDREVLFQRVNTYCEDFKLGLVHFSQERERVHGERAILTTPITVKGKFVDMIKLAYRMEHIDQLGHLGAVHFLTKADIRSRQTYLLGTFYFQHIKPDPDVK